MGDLYVETAFIKLMCFVYYVFLYIPRFHLNPSIRICVSAPKILLQVDPTRVLSLLMLLFPKHRNIFYSAELINLYFNEEFHF
jgi:hypothetical protein